MIAQRNRSVKLNLFDAAKRIDGMTHEQFQDYHKCVSDCCGMALKLDHDHEGKKTGDWRCSKCRQICEAIKPEEYNGQII